MGEEEEGRSTQDDGVFRATLVTRGRRTGRSHAVRLRAVSHAGKIYLSRRRPDGDWYLNAAANPDVRVMYEGAGVGEGVESIAGTARVVTDEGLLRLISRLKYPGQKKADERRVAIEVSPGRDGRT